LPAPRWSASTFAGDQAGAQPEQAQPTPCADVGETGATDTAGAGSASDG